MSRWGGALRARESPNTLAPMRGHLGRFLLLGVLVLALPGGAQAAPSWLAPATLDDPTPNVGADLPTAVAMNRPGGHGRRVAGLPDPG